MLRNLHRLTFSAPAQPVFDRLTRRRYREAYLSLMQTQWLSREQIRALQLRSLERVLNHAWSYSPFHRERLHAAGWSPGSAVDFDVLHDLPVMEREDLKDRLDDVATISRFRFDRVDKVTSGGTTTGTPIKLYNDGWASDLKGAVWLRNNSWIGVPPGSRACTLAGASIGVSRNPSRKEEIIRLLKGRITFPAWDLSDESMAAYARRIERFRPAVLWSYPSSLLLLADFLRRRGRALSVPHVVSVGEMLPLDSREPIEERLGGTLFEAYGCNEVSHIAHACESCSTMHINDENVLVEAEAGSSELLLTDLTNLATPLIRYRVGDRGTVSQEPARCGRGMTTLTSVQGRTLDIIDLGGGGRTSVATFTVVFRGFPDVSAYQIWQEKPGELQVLIQSREEPPEAISRILATHLKDTRVEVIRVDSIPVTAGGKRPYFVKGRTYHGQKDIGRE